MSKQYLEKLHKRILRKKFYTHRPVNQHLIYT